LQQSFSFIYRAAQAAAVRLVISRSPCMRNDAQITFLSRVLAAFWAVEQPLQTLVLAPKTASLRKFMSDTLLNTQLCIPLIEFY